jgi:hypothetical protein
MTNVKNACEMIIRKGAIMKYFLVCLTVVLLTGVVATTVYAANTDTCRMSVTVTTSKDVTITDDPLAFGSVPAGGGNSAVSTTGCTVTNTATGSQSYSLRLTEYPATWSIMETAGATGAEQIKLLALFTSSNPPATGAFNDTAVEDVVKQSGGTTATDAVYAIDTEGDDVQGFNCTATSVRKLWFKFMSPLSTSLTTVQYLTVTVTAL